MTSILDDAQSAGADRSPRPGWFRRLVDAFFGPREEPPPPPPPEPPVGSASLRRDMKEPIMLPAKGDAFKFHLRAYIVWYSEGLTKDELLYWTERFYIQARSRLKHDAARQARRFEPHRAREFEDHLNDTLGRQIGHVSEDGVSLRYELQVRVEPDEPVREQLRGFWADRIKMDCAHELDMRRAELVHRLTEEWSSILEKLHEDPLTPHAARLSEEQFAKVFGEFAAQRKQGIDQIIELLREAVRQQDTLGLGPSEYTRTWDAALQTLLRQYGTTEAT